MTARAMWKGSIEIGKTALPVKLYSAIEERRVHFRVLASDEEPAEQRYVDPSNDEVVPYENVRRGFPIEGGFVVLTKEELATIEPEASRAIAVARFVGERKLGPEWFVRPYYLGPDGSTETYFALSKALADTGTEGIAHWVMRSHAYTGVLRSVGGYLMLLTVRHENEVVTRAELPAFEGRPYGALEKKMASELVDAYSGDLDPADLVDTYRDRVEAFVRAKAGGKKPRLAKVRAKPESGKLEDALARSLAALKKERSKTSEREPPPHRSRPSRSRRRKAHAEETAA